MRESNDTTPRNTSRPFAAIMAAFLAVALALMAFDANTLRTAFADDGEASAVLEPAGGDAENQGGDDGDQPGVISDERQGEDVDGSLTVEGEEEEETVDEDSASARDGPFDSDESISAGGVGESSVMPGPSEQQDSEANSNAKEDEQDAEADDSDQQAAELDSCYVTFYSDAGDTPSILARKHVSAEEGQSASVDVSDVYADAPTGAQQFDGWLYDGETYRDYIVVAPANGDVSLYPSFLSGHWLRFVSGTANANASYIPSQFVPADSGELDTLPVPNRAGYAFSGWFTGSLTGGEIAYADQVTDDAGKVLNPTAFRHDVSQSDVELYAKWSGVQTEYRVITWHENPDDEGYTYQGYYTVGDDEGESAVSGEMTNVSEAEEYPGFTLRDYEQKTIEGDGSTVINLYYDRIEYSIVFHQERSDDSPLFDDLTITAKYGADIHDEWPKASEGNGVYTSAWYTLPDASSNVFVTGVGTMPLGGASYYPMNDSGTYFNLVFRVQSVDGSNTFSDYVSQPFSTPGSTKTTADDYKPIKGFMVNAASAADAQLIRENPAGDKAATYNPDFTLSATVGENFNSAPEVSEGNDVPRHTLYFYYLRCQYDVVFEENGGPEASDVKGVYYEASLAGKSPSNYVVGETVYESIDGEAYTFQGWYDNEALEGEPFDFENAKMPAGNVVLYASWEPTRHLVQVDPAGGEFVSPAQSTYFYVDHGETVGAIQVERQYVADEDGDYVYNYESATTDPDSDGYGAAEYLPAAEGDTGDRYRWSPGVYTLYGWYVNGMTTLADEPFDFNDPITEDTSIIARWRSSGVFDIAYDPAVEVNGDLVSGDIATMIDEGYADLSPTYVMNTPEGIESESGSDYEFVGWQVVESFDEGADVLVAELYSEGDGFVVDSELARENTIHLQAVYELDDDPSDDPADPADPVIPVDPVDPADPTTPVDPVDPADPTTPVDPEEPTTPDATQPAPSNAPTNATNESGLFPQTGDMSQMLAFAIGGIALLSLAVALFGYMLRRGVASIHIDQHDPNGR